jgi:hypothetical protein
MPAAAATPELEALAVSVALPLAEHDVNRALRGREGQIAVLTGLVDRPDGAGRVRLLYGLGGSGKTSIALHVALHAARRGVVVWWVSAAERTSLISTGLRLPVVRVQSDGTYLSVVIDPKIRGKRREQIVQAARDGVELDPEQAYMVRVVEYDVPDRDGNGTGELIVLLTSVLDPADARSDELAGTYHQRWGTGNRS